MEFWLEASIISFKLQVSSTATRQGRGLYLGDFEHYF